MLKCVNAMSIVRRYHFLLLPALFDLRRKFLIEQVQRFRSAVGDDLATMPHQVYDITSNSMHKVGYNGRPTYVIALGIYPETVAD